MADIDQDGEFTGWFILELMGHRKLAGYCEPRQVAGAAMLRVDVPQADETHPAYTTFVGGQSLYSFTKVDEQTARDYVTAFKPEPIEVYSLQRAAQVAARREFDRLKAKGLPDRTDDSSGDDAGDLQQLHQAAGDAGDYSDDPDDAA